MRARASRKLAPLQSTLVLVVVAAVLVRVFSRLEFYLGSTFRHTLVDTGLLAEQTPLASRNQKGRHEACFATVALSTCGADACGPVATGFRRAASMRHRGCAEACGCLATFQVQECHVKLFALLGKRQSFVRGAVSRNQRMRESRQRRASIGPICAAPHARALAKSTPDL